MDGGARAAGVEIQMALGGGRSQLCSRGRHCGWEGAGSAAGAGLTLAERGGVGSRGPPPVNGRDVQTLHY